MQLQQPNFVANLQTQLKIHSKTKPWDLELEILETNRLEDVTQVAAIINTCYNMGISFALDDFGTGYSSLTYLRQLPVKTLKIDQSFVRGMLDNPEDLSILQGVLGLANAFNRKAIAEGVETLAHSKLLLNMGYEIGQGYFIARPMPAEQIKTWVSNWMLNFCPISSL